jgi:hypothetical protein
MRTACSCPQQSRYNIDNVAIAGCLYLASGLGNIVGARVAGRMSTRLDLSGRSLIISLGGRYRQEVYTKERIQAARRSVDSCCPGRWPYLAFICHHLRMARTLRVGPM